MFDSVLCVLVSIVGRAILKMLRRKSKMQFVKQERNTQNAIALLNYLKRIAPQQLMLRTKMSFVWQMAMKAHCGIVI
jgi:hypothetical protein